MKLELDRYTRRARLAPALLVPLPVAFAFVAVLPDTWAAAGTFWGLLLYAGGSYFLTQIGRASGKSKQEFLFDAWGGAPTTRDLRHRNASNPTLLLRRHMQLVRLLPDLSFPSAAEEEANPEAADHTYETATTFLRTSTGDHEKFPLVFEENCSYGFRRNLWGLKPWGLSCCLLALAVIGLRYGLFSDSVNELMSILAAPALLLSIGFLLVWVGVITPDWVKSSADAYSERLLESIERLSASE
ncbi:MAG: hypothetical protein NXI30_15720 [bacterium]|nr:hypothetical protein [bacterium]